MLNKCFWDYGGDEVVEEDECVLWCLIFDELFFDCLSELMLCIVEDLFV